MELIYYSGKYDVGAVNNFRDFFFKKQFFKTVVKINVPFGAGSPEKKNYLIFTLEIIQ